MPHPVSSGSGPWLLESSLSRAVATRARPPSEVAPLRAYGSPGPGSGPRTGVPWPSHDRRTSPITGAQARGPPRPRRAPALPVLPVRRPRPAGRQASRVGPAHARRPARRARQGRDHRPPARLGGGDRRAPVEEEGARDLQLRRHLLVAPTRPRRSCASWSSPAPAALIASIQVAIAIAIMLTVVAISYRQVCRAFPNGGGAYAVARSELTPLARADRRGGPAHRLRHDRRGVDVLGTRPARLTRPAAGGLEGRDGHRRRSRSSRSATCAGCASPATSSPSPPTLFVVLALVIVAIGARATSWPAPPNRSPPGRRGALRDRATRALPAAARLRVRLRRADRHRGDRQRRAGVQAARGEERRRHADRHGVLLGVLFIGITFVADAFGIVPIDRVARHRWYRLVAGATLRRSGRPLYTLFHWRPRSSCSWPRTPRSTRSRGWPRSSPRTATCPASSRSAATGSPSRGASSCWPASRSR